MYFGVVLGLTVFTFCDGLAFAPDVMPDEADGPGFLFGLQPHTIIIIIINIKTHNKTFFKSYHLRI